MPKKLIKIARSFSMKKNLGNYQTADFWMMQEVECAEEEAEKKSEEIYQFVKSQVLKAYNEYGVMPKPEEEYAMITPGNSSVTVDLGANGKFPKAYKAEPTDSWRATDYSGGKEKIIKEESEPY